MKPSKPTKAADRPKPGSQTASAKPASSSAQRPTTPAKPGSPSGKR